MFTSWHLILILTLLGNKSFQCCTLWLKQADINLVNPKLNTHLTAWRREISCERICRACLYFWAVEDEEKDFAPYAEKDWSSFYLKVSAFNHVFMVSYFQRTAEQYPESSTEAFISPWKKEFSPPVTPLHALALPREFFLPCCHWMSRSALSISDPTVHFLLSLCFLIALLLSLHSHMFHPYNSVCTTTACCSVGHF